MNYLSCLLILVSYLLLNRKLNQIKMTTAEAVAKVEAQTLQLKKIASEVQAIKDALTEAQENGDEVPQVLADAIEAASVEIQTIDDLNEDAADPTDDTEGTNG